MTSSLSPGSADALLFDIGRVVLDISVDNVMAVWAGHAGCAPADLASRYVANDSYKQHEVGKIDDAAFFAGLRASLGIAITDQPFLEGCTAISPPALPRIPPPSPPP